MKSVVQKLKDALPLLQEALGKLARQEVLVGVPADKASRKESDGMNNATIAYVHDNGSPARNIPARPFMRPGIIDAKSRISEHLKIAAKRVLTGEAGSIDKDLIKVGLTAQAAIRNKINEGIPPPLAAGTLAARRRRGRSGTKPLVDTGQLRNSINYVVREK